MPLITFDIERMIALRIEGWSYARLSREFHKDHTTILYHCVKLGITPHVPISQELKERQFKKREVEQRIYKYDYMFTEKINKGKSYKEYLADALKRKTEKGYHKIYYENTNVTHILANTPKAKEAPRGEDYTPGPPIL